ncbi:gliding motility-associated C-terminal domain-containing protein [Flavobacterium sp. N2820]|uniref:T9SS type B sorting domain-containing protein n=1 Tax=Flavobacterium sp. N2820 TaxID=2986834 RepID=UPI002224D9EA|nr:gliding motility-associated C-terminal domain-containing protein [Flavobacterium sp. N2820]
MESFPIDFFSVKNSCRKHTRFLLVLFVFFSTVNVFSQNYENVAITGVISGNNTNNCLFSATSPTLPTLARVRVQQISGGGNVRIYRTGDNFTYEHNSGFTAGIPNNLTRFRISFLLADGVTTIPVNDYRFVINDIDGANNESLATNCGSGIRFTATAIPTNLVVDNTPPDLNATGTVNETGGTTSRVMYEFNDLNQIEFDCYANNGFIKEFDINYNNFTIATPLYAVCLNDSDGDGVTDDLDLDDDNDGILDSVEAGGNDPNGDHDGDGLPNFLDVTDNSGAHPTYIANADGSVTNYTDADSDGVPDVYESSLDGDSIPNHLDLDSDDDGCSDSNEYYASLTADGGDGGVYGIGVPAVNPNGTVVAASYIGSFANVVSSGSVSTINTQPTNQITIHGLNATFSIVNSGGSGITNYQWQESTNNGSTWNNVINGGIYGGATTNTLNLTGVLASMNGYDYRVIISETNYICANVQSLSANLTVTNVIVANNDATPADLSTVNGYTGGVAGDLTTNDTLNGVAVIDTEITITVVNNGGLTGVAIATNGNISVPAGTPAGSYTVEYQICENLNPTNCDTAFATVVVDAAPIVANDDATPADLSTVNGYTGGVAGDLTTNDTLNGVAVIDTEITITVVNNGGLTGVAIATNGNISVPAGTPAGSYTVEYQICENLNPTNCDTAFATVVVDAAPIVANNDATPADLSTVNGYTGGVAGDVTTNDTLNGVAVIDTEITITVLADGGLTGVAIATNGNISVPAGTPAGSYTVEYQICENLNPTNCDTAFATVVVDAAPIVANNDATPADLSTVNGYTGGVAGDLTTNDTLNGVAVIDTEITITVLADGGLTGVAIATNGNISVPAGTPAGSYTLEYQICENLNPTNCDTAFATVVVDAAPIVANNDATPADLSTVNGYTGGVAGDLTTNDTLNGVAVIDTEITITVLADGGLTGVAIATNGNISVPAGTPAGSYTVEYQICENLNPTNCDTAFATVVVDAAPIVANNDATPADLSTVNGYTGGVAGDLTTNDTLNGVAVIDTEITITVLADGGLTGVAIATNGNISVPAGTPAGSYTVEYQICENLNPTNCDTAFATVVVDAAPIVANNDATPADLSTVNGYTGGVAGDLTTNDTLNGVAVIDTEITITVVNNGGLTGVAIATNGNISVPAGTPAGSYTVEYQICENLNPTNCDTAFATVVVDAAPIVANNDATPADLSTVNGYTGGVAGDLTTNDTLNGVAVIDTEITITVVNNGGLTGVAIATNGNISVPAGTPAGSYTVEYQICENLNPTNCDTAFATVVVDAAPIVANNDATPADLSTVNGYTGGVAGDLTTNDTLNGVAVIDTEITITVVNNGGLTGVAIATNGNISVPAGTPAGSYTVEYQICENLNPTNCDTAFATVVVDAAPIVANNDATPADLSTVNGYTGGVAGDLTTNDTLNGVAVIDTEITITVVNNGGLTGVAIATNGNISVPAGTPAGSYTVEYQICENLNPTNCDTAFATVVVDAAPIVANNDATPADLSTVNGYTGGVAGDLTTNDTLNGVAVIDTEITITVVNNGGLTGVAIATNGNISVPAGTPAGNYTVEYQICENLNPTNCDTAFATVVVDAAPIVANDDATPADLSTVNGYTGGVAGDVTTNDTLNGVAVIDTEITITVLADGGLTGVAIATNGNISVPAGTPAGSYTVEYQICENLNPTNCDTAFATVVVDAAPIVANNDATPADLSTVNGYTGGVAGDVTTNDTLNSVAVIDTEITITILADGGLTGVAIATNGNISVPAGTPAGSYTVEYQICENLNPTNCDTAFATVVVDAAPIVANNDATPADLSTVNGYTGGVAGDLTTNDTLNGVAVVDTEITITVLADGGLTGVAIATNGNISVPAGTPAGSYTVEYQICENLNPTNCDTAFATVVVDAAPIVANNDATPADLSTVNGYTGGVAGDLTTNDTLNSVAVIDTEITITVLADGGLTGVAIATNGNISVPAGTPAGSYTVEYQICENLNPTNCDTAFATVVVDAAPIVANNDDFSSVSINETLGGVAGDVTTNDTLNGVAVIDTEITITILADGGLTGVTIAANGDLSVPAGTPAGTYTVEYQICENLNPTNCDNAFITVVVLPDNDGDGIDDIVDIDDDNDGITDIEEQNGNPILDTDGDGVIDSFDLDADGDGVNDVFEAGHGESDVNNDGIVDGPVGVNGMPDAVEGGVDGAGPDYTPQDSDADGVHDFQDIDDDNDGVNTEFENPNADGDGNPNTGTTQDTDVDGIDDYLDIDDDNDGVNTEFENPNADGDGNPNTGTTQDTDGDGIDDYLDIDDDNDGVNTEFENPNADGDGNPNTGTTQDTDGDGIDDYLDIDDDNDGVNTEFENPNADGDGNPNTGTTQDTDGDGIDDYLDIDDDNDGVNTEFENPNADGDGNPNTGTTQDTDGDGIDDYLDIDDDNDGVNTEFENPNADGDGNPNTGTTQDTDGDGIDDYLDIDDDNDGVNTEFENPNADGDGNPNTGTTQDTDGDGIDDYLDIDDDNDGVNTEFENPNADGDGNPNTGTTQDTDGDGIDDYLDIDDDNDGVNTEFENPNADGDGNPNTGTTQDTDGDGIDDYLDIDDDNDGVNTEFENPNADGDGNPNTGTTQDTDGDGTPDYLDVDDDGDLVDTEFENPDPNGDGNPSDAQDTDGDGTPDYLDVDDDGDLVDTEFENPDPNGDGNPSDAQDTDGDGTPDYLDEDDDGDLVDTEFENPDPNGDGNPSDAQDTDGDGTPDYLDVDDDGDLVNTEFENPDPNGDGNPSDAQDTDGDGTPDYLDVDDDGDLVDTEFENPDPNGDGNPSDAQDTDGDGTPDYLDVDDDGDSVDTEFENPDPNGDGNPSDAQDTDGDGTPDYLDVDDDGDLVDTEFENPDPNGDGNPSDAQDTDGDGTPDYLDLDDDGDGIPTADENPDPNGDGDPSDAQDTDGDGIPDYLDADDDNDGIIAYNEGGNIDTDGDGLPNYLDQDADGDGIPDNVEAQTTAGYIVPSGVDTNNNGIDDAYDTGLTPIDTDGDGTNDMFDLDSDNDGVHDQYETGVDLAGTDTDNDGLDDNVDTTPGYDDPNGIFVTPSDDLQDTDGTEDVDYRDIDDDGDGLDTETENGDENGDGNPDDAFDSDGDGIPDYLEFNNHQPSSDDLEIFNLVTPNGDGDNDVFVIRNIELYPDNTVQIYNRWGILVYEVSSYNPSEGRAFVGLSEGRVTISQSSELPVGTYFYVVKYRNSAGNSKERSGYLYINR